MSSTVIAPANGNKSLTAGVYNVIYIAPLDCVSATVNFRLISRDLTQNIKTRIAIVPNGFIDGSATPPPNNTWIAPIDIILGPNGVTSGIIEDTAIVLSPGETIIAYVDADLVTARVHGLIRTIGA